MDTRTGRDAQSRMRAILAELCQPMTRRSLRVSFLFSLVFVSLLYRGMLCHSLYTEQGIPPQYSKEVPILYFWKAICSDFLVAATALGVIFFLRTFLARFTGKTRGWLAAVFALTKHLFANGALLIAALVMLIHYRLLFEVNTGLTFRLLNVGFRQIGFANSRDFMRLSDLAFVLSPSLVFYLSYFWGARLNRGAMACCLAALAVGLGLQVQPHRNDAKEEIMQNPVRFLINDAMDAVAVGGLGQGASPFADDSNLPGQAQMHSVKLVDSAFVSASASKPQPICPSAPNKKWNVLFLIMESTGAEYVFDPSFSNDVPMPFLHRMAKEGLNLTNHYSTSNYSIKAGFSLFSGLYPRPGPVEFSMNSRVCVPTINSFLGGEYRSFVVTPASFSMCFPHSLLVNNGLRDFCDRDSIPLPKRPRLYKVALHESDAVDFLIEKLDKTTEPFFGVYWSWIPHWPYLDYGKEFQIARCPTEKQTSYYNNLRVLDLELKRIFDHLEATGKLRNTILVFVGDHGQGFGRHSNAMMHGIGTYEETYKTPAIFYQPALFTPRRITWATSHIDILPTLLDAMGVHYRDDKLQGESVLRGEPARKYVFTISAMSDYVSAIDRSSLKVSLSLVNSDAYAYDLSNDPLETKRLSIASFPEQVDAAVKFRAYQADLIGRYNQCLWEKRSWDDDGKSSNPAPPDAARIR